ncbi:TPA: 2,3-diphosphoglycerate-dependent phosphoglycerate mutase GpmB [Salmonella enterica subsp. enterica serovar Dublin]|nr:2,3-diphosphoglycerate-dependent phosphoglycerate mutase GpmB [Salmonella enterica subsp. enterica serovar Dublin]
MLQVYLVRHGETQWNAERRIQGQSDSPLTAKGEQQAMQVGERARSLGITHIISSDLGRTKRTAEIIAQACGCDITFDSRLRELDMGVLEKRQIDSLTEEEEGWRRQLVNGTQDGRIPGGESMQDGRIPGGESMQELSDRVHAALASCLELPQGSRPLLVSHGIALGCLVSTILGLPAWAERRLRLRNCSISRIDYQESQWLASGWVVETAGDVSHLDAPALDELQR